MKRRDGDFKGVPDMEGANFSPVYPLFPQARARVSDRSTANSVLLTIFSCTR